MYSDELRTNSLAIKIIAPIFTLFVAGAAWTTISEKEPIWIIVTFSAIGFFIVVAMWWGIIWPRIWKIAIEQQHLKISDSYGKENFEVDFAEVDHLEVNYVPDYHHFEDEPRIDKIRIVLINGKEVKIPLVFYHKYETILNHLKSLDYLKIVELNKDCISK